MTNRDTITRLCVGGPMVITLGVPVGQGADMHSGVSALRWKDGQWETKESILDKIGRFTARDDRTVLTLNGATPKGKNPLTPSSGSHAGASRLSALTRRQNIIAACTIAIAIGIAAGVTFSSIETAPKEQELPVAQAGRPEAGQVPVKVVPEAFPLPGNGLTLPQADGSAPPPEANAPQDQQNAVEQGGAQTPGVPSIPIVAAGAAVTPGLAASAVPSGQSKVEPVQATKQVAQPGKVLPTQPSVVTPTPPKSNLVVPSIPNNAVVAPVVAPTAKDAVAAKDAKDVKGGKEAPKTKDEPKPSAMILDEQNPAKDAKPAPKTEAAAKPEAKPEPKVGSGLVALTPDGKYALFTNQKTRLPEKFAVGDKLPSGEVLKSIDKNAGKATTDSKEYRLE